MEFPRRLMDKSGMPRFARHCLSVKAMVRVESVVKIVVKMPMVKIVIEIMKVILTAKT